MNQINRFCAAIMEVVKYKLGERVIIKVFSLFESMIEAYSTLVVFLCFRG
jgi:hypothetical protein